MIIPTGDANIDTAALQAAMSDSAQNYVQLAPGTFALGKRALRAAVRLDNRTCPLVVRGAPDGATVLKLVDMSGGLGGDCHVISLNACENISLLDLTLDGNLSGFPGFNQQAHGVYVYGGRNITLWRVSTRNVIMDGAYFMGTDGGPLLDGVRILDTTHAGNNRNGLSFQGGTANVLIDGFTARNIKNAAIDTEPTGGRPAPTNFIIRNADIEARTEADVMSIADSNNFVVENLLIRAGSLQVFRANNVTLAGVRIVSRPERPPLTIRAADNLLISDCEFIGRHTGHPDAAVSIGSGSGIHCGHVRIADSTITTPAGRHGIEAENANALEVDGCRIFGGGTYAGVAGRNIVLPALAHLEVTGNQLENFANGVSVNVKVDHRLALLVVLDNRLMGVTTPVLLESAGFIDRQVQA